MLFKYSRCSEYAIENLANSQVYCRHFSEFNDPFEFWSLMEEGVPTPKDVIRLQRAMHAWGFDAEYSDPLVQQYFDEVKDYQANFSYAFRGVRISCFSREVRNLLMWSHYADGLRGFCVEFDETVFAKEAEVLMLDVNYQARPPHS